MCKTSNLETCLFSPPVTHSLLSPFKKKQKTKLPGGVVSLTYVHCTDNLMSLTPLDWLLAASLDHVLPGRALSVRAC